LRYSGVALALPAVGLLLAIWFVRSERRLDARLVAWGGCALLFVYLFARYRRFVEDEPAFAVMFAAVAWSVLLGARGPRARLAEYADVVRFSWPVAPELVLLLVVAVLAWGAPLPVPYLQAAIRNLAYWQEAILAMLAALGAIGWAAALEAQAVQPAAGGAPPGARAARVGAPVLANAAVPAVLLALPLLVGVTLSTRHDTAGTDPPTYYSGAGEWLAQHTLPGERVFATDWDDFPRLFYYDTRDVYLVGLDPTYMALYDQSLYLRWRDIGRGDTPFTAEEIRTRFGARWIFTDTQHTGFLRMARQVPELKQVYSDPDTVVLLVGPA